MSSNWAAPPFVELCALARYLCQAHQPAQRLGVAELVKLTTAEVHDYHGELIGVLAGSVAKCASGYTSLGSPLHCLICPELPGQG